MKDIVVDGTGFNIEYWSRYNLQQFLSETMKSKFYKHLPDEKRIELLTIVWKLINEFNAT